MTGADWAMLTSILIILVILTGLAVAEMGLSRISRPKASSLADRGDKGGQALLRLVTNPERWVNPLLLTVNVCQTVQATFTGILAGRLFGAPGVAIGVTLNVLVFFVMAEAVPKTYAVLYPERAALVTARPVAALVAFPPLRLASRALIGLTNVIVRGKGLEKGPFVSEQELLGIVEAAADDDVIEHEERELIESIIEFGDTVAREVMVPRPDMVTLDETMTISEALDVAISQGYSRLPVLSGGEDEDVVGLAYAKDLMRLEREGRGNEPVSATARQVKVVPENKPVARLMREMQRDKFHLTLVADEYGELVGLVSLEDCLEELVGEIIDEFDVEDHQVQRLANGEYLVDGGMSISDLNELLDLSIPDDEWDTIAGFVFGALEHVPEPGEAVRWDDWWFIAETIEGRRIRQVRVSLVDDDADRAADADAVDIGIDLTDDEDTRARQ
jgi:putative hemolysin